MISEVRRRGGGGVIESPTDDDFAAAARWALKHKDFRLAAQQASAAVVLRPRHEPHLRLLDEVIAKARAPLEVLALPAKGAFFGLCAARARALARLERFDEAIRTLFEAAAFSPDTPFVPWAAAWVATAKAARRVAPETVADALVSLAEATRGRALSPGARENLEAALAVAERVQARHPASEGLLVAQCRVLRALGRTEDAAARLAAADAYARALALDASSGWARVSLAYARALATGGGCAADLAGDAESERERARARALEADLSAYVTRVADPIDPVIRVIRSAGEQAAGSPARLRVRVRADRPLAPSARIAFSQQMSALGREAQLVVEVEQGGGPARPGALWKEDGGGLVAAVPRPPEVVIDRVRDLAGAAFTWDGWRARAVELSSRLDPSDAARVVDAMAHPPEPPSRDADPVLWIHGYQVAAAVLAACGPEAPRARMERLGALLSGVDDWSSAAALLGLRALAGAHPELRGEIVERAVGWIPEEGEPLPALSRALAVLGCELAAGEERRRFLRLRGRVVADLAADEGRERARGRARESESEIERGGDAIRGGAAVGEVPLDGDRGSGVRVVRARGYQRCRARGKRQQRACARCDRRLAVRGGKPGLDLGARRGAGQACRETARTGTVPPRARREQAQDDYADRVDVARINASPPDPGVAL